jgi:cytochrome c biogenesis protein CcdA
MNTLQGPIVTIGTLSGVRFIGRRATLMVSSTICSFCFLMVIICFALLPKNSGTKFDGHIVRPYLLFAFAFVWTPCQALYHSEVIAYNSRAKGLAMSGLWVNILYFINTYAAPVGITQEVGNSTSYTWR